MTTRLPAASISTSGPTERSNGKFHGTMLPDDALGLRLDERAPGAVERRVGVARLGRHPRLRAARRRRRRGRRRPRTSIRSVASVGCTPKSALIASWICVRWLITIPASACEQRLALLERGERVGQERRALALDDLVRARRSPRRRRCRSWRGARWLTCASSSDPFGGRGENTPPGAAAAKWLTRGSRTGDDDHAREAEPEDPAQSPAKEGPCLVTRRDRDETALRGGGSWASRQEGSASGSLCRITSAPWSRLDCSRGPAWGPPSTPVAFPGGTPAGHRTRDLRVMSPTSYLTAPPRVAV